MGQFSSFNEVFNKTSEFIVQMLTLVPFTLDPFNTANERYQTNDVTRRVVGQFFQLRPVRHIWLQDKNILDATL